MREKTHSHLLILDDALTKKERKKRVKIIKMANTEREKKVSVVSLNDRLSPPPIFSPGPKKIK